MIRISWYGILFCCILVLNACSQSDQKGELIIGNWTLMEAIRQGRPTSTLSGLRFTFTKDSLYTNLPDFKNNNYTYSQDTVTIQALNPYSFQVFHVDSSHLDLCGEIQQVRFRLKFKKIQP